MRGAILVLAVAVLLSITPAAPTTYLIEPDGSGDFPTIQAGINWASPGDTVLAADGVFTGPGNRDIEFHGKDLVLKSEHGPEATVLDADYSGRLFFIRGLESRACVIEGFTMTHGAPWEDMGGAIRTVFSSPTIRNCIITDNYSIGMHEGDGGGIACLNTCSPLIEGCVITENTAFDDMDGWGGGVLVAWNASPTLRDCVIAGNESRFGGGIHIEDSAASLIGCVISGNSGDFGGGINLSNSSQTTIRECTISGNRGYNCAGGVRCGSLSLERTIVWGNCSTYGTDEIEYSGALSLWCCALDSSGVAGSGTVEYLETVFSNPLFCDPMPCDSAITTEGDYRVDVASPCVPSNSPCGESIGALGVGCPLAPVWERDDLGSPVSDGIVFGIPSPNPTMGSLFYSFNLPRADKVRVSVFDVRGALIQTLLDRHFPAGHHRLSWSPEMGGPCHLTGGVYYLRLDAGGSRQTRKFVVAR